MPDSKRKHGKPDRRKVAATEPYEAKKHDISREQARELMRKVGRDRDKLNEAAAKIFRK